MKLYEVDTQKTVNICTSLIYVLTWISKLAIGTLAVKSGATTVMFHMTFILRTAVWQSHHLGKFVHRVCRVASVNKMATLNFYFLSVPLSSAGLIQI